MSPRSSALGLAPAPRRFLSLPQWLVWQEGLHVTEIELGLDRCREVALRLGLRKPEYTVVSVAGTNGKGSSVAMLAAILEAEGYRVATYTSPHLLQYNERIRINGKTASDDDLCDAFQRIDESRQEVSLTYFEFGTLAALDLMQRGDIDLAILEVGLGGRLDAVNLVDADVALVTAIGVDHINWLGNDRSSIAREKAGIFRSGHPAVCSDPDAPRSLRDYADYLQSPLYLLGRDFHYRGADSEWSWYSEVMTYDRLPRPRLIGDFQLQNAAGVIMTLQLLTERFSVSERAVRRGLTALELPGRLQVIPGPVQYVLDVAHNPHAARELAKILQQQPTAGRTHILIGMLKDKDTGGVFVEVKDLADAWHLVSLPGPRGACAQRLADELAVLATSVPIVTYRNVEQALAAMQAQLKSGDRVLVMGSFLTVAGVLHQLNGKV